MAPRSFIPPRRIPNAVVRTREYLTPDEVRALTSSAESVGRHPLRDSSSIQVAYRHGLRVSELIDLRWEQIDFPQRLLHIRRLKNRKPASHPLGKAERRTRRLQHRRPTRTYIRRYKSGQCALVPPLSERLFPAGQLHATRPRRSPRG